MPTLNLKPTHKPIQEYYAALDQTIQQMSLLHEGAVAPHFANLLRACASRVGWTLQEQFQIPRKGQKPLRADGVLLDDFKLRHGVWEAKDSKDDLAVEVKKKFAQGYPQDNGSRLSRPAGPTVCRVPGKGHKSLIRPIPATPCQARWV